MGKAQSQSLKNYQLKTTPWEHQLIALDYLYSRDTAALYTDMGSGKTKIILDLIINRGFKTTLVVCTNKGCAVWEKQIMIHTHLKPCNVLNLYDMSTDERISAVKDRLAWRKQCPAEETLIIIINYEGVWRPNFLKLMLGKRTHLDCTVCDESHRIKSPSTKCSRALSRIGNICPHRYLVTGTPLAENPVDVYAQYRFLDSSIFGTRFSDFKDYYQNVDIRRTASVGHIVLDNKEPYKNLDVLKEKMYSVAFRMPSSVKLPNRRNFVCHFEIPKKAAAVYRQIEKEGVVILKAGTLEVNNSLTLMLRKQQITSGFVPVEDEDGNRKLISLGHARDELLQELLEGLDPTEPVVVFAQFKADLKRIQKVCNSIGRGYSELSGETDTEASWQAGKTSVLGVQYTSGSESVDFTRSRYTIYYSLTNRLSLYLQSKKRTHRPGQTRTTYYYHLVADIDKKFTVDWHIVEALRLKKEIVDYVMEREEEG